MATIVRSVRERLLPAVLTADGVTLIGAGLLTFTGNAAAAEPSASAEPTTVAIEPTETFVVPSLPPIGKSPSFSIEPTSSANPDRVIVEQLGIPGPTRSPAAERRPRRVHAEASWFAPHC